MGAGAGQRGGMPQSTPQVVPQAIPQIPPGVPAQGGISSLAAQGAQMDPRLAAIMQAMQQRSTMSPSMQPSAPMTPSAAMTPRPPVSGGLSGKGAGMPQGPMPQRPMTQNRPFDPRLAMMLRQR